MTTNNNTETATKTLNQLMDARDQLVGRSAKISADRQAISYAAYTGDKAAKERLRKLNDESVLHNTEIESVDAAIVEANSRLATAKRDESLAADREQAIKLRESVAKFKEHGKNVDDALWDFVTSIKAMLVELDTIHTLGQQAPSAENFRVNAVICIKTALQVLPASWVRDFDFSLLNPSQKRAFRDVVSSWEAGIDKNIASRLGETKQTEAA